MTLDLPYTVRREYYILDTDDLIGRLTDELVQRQEHPIVRFDHEETREWFMRDLCHLIEFDRGAGQLSKDLDAVLNRSAHYLGQPFTRIQRLLWRRFAFELTDRFAMHGFYNNDDCISSHEYVRMIGNNILMRNYAD